MEINNEELLEFYEELKSEINKRAEHLADYLITTTILLFDK